MSKATYMSSDREDDDPSSEDDDDQDSDYEQSQFYKVEDINNSILNRQAP